MFFLLSSIVLMCPYFACLEQLCSCPSLIFLFSCVVLIYCTSIHQASRLDFFFHSVNVPCYNVVPSFCFFLLFLDTVKAGYKDSIVIDHGIVLL